MVDDWMAVDVLAGRDRREGKELLAEVCATSEPVATQISCGFPGAVLLTPEKSRESC
jgi:hypothetical protein